MCTERFHEPGESTCRARGRLSDLAFYRITVRGCLDRSWSERLGGLKIAANRHRGETVLCGLIRDQSALHGVLTELHNLNLPLLRLVRREARTLNDQTDQSKE